MLSILAVTKELFQMQLVALVSIPPSRSALVFCMTEVFRLGVASLAKVFAV